MDDQPPKKVKTDDYRKVARYQKHLQKVHNYSHMAAKLTPELLDRVCQHIEVGASPLIAAQAEGLSKDTVSSWLLAVETGHTAAGLPLSPEIEEFGRRIEIAQARFHTETLALMSRISKGEVTKSQWLPSAWVLERTQRERYSLLPQPNVQSVEVTVKAALEAAEKKIALADDDPRTTTTIRVTKNKSGKLRAESDEGIQYPTEYPE